MHSCSLNLHPAATKHLLCKRDLCGLKKCGDNDDGPKGRRGLPTRNMVTQNDIQGASGPSARFTQKIQEEEPPSNRRTVSCISRGMWEGYNRLFDGACSRVLLLHPVSYHSIYTVQYKSRNLAFLVLVGSGAAERAETMAIPSAFREVIATDNNIVAVVGKHSVHMHLGAEFGEAETA